MNYDTLLVDGPYLAHRSYDAPYKLTTSNGRDATMIHSFIRSLNSFRKKFKPNQIIVAWESPGTPSWRRKQYPAYKGTRDKLDSQYIYQLNDLQKLLHLLNVNQYNSPTNEADDVIANLTVGEAMDFNNVLIFSSDKDLMQLVDIYCHMYNGKQLYTVDDVKEKFGVLPKYLPDLLAITGDKSDNIEGIEGFGNKKAAKLVNEECHVEEIDFGSCSTNIVWSEQLKKKILNNKYLIMLNYDCKLERIPKYRVNESLISILNKYELNSIKNKIEEYKLMGNRGER